MKKDSFRLKRVWLYGLVVALAAVVWGGLLAGRWLLGPVASGNKEKEAFIVTRGASVDRIGRELATAKLIRQAAVFKFLVMVRNLGNKIQAGSFQLSSGMSVEEIIGELTDGRQDFWVTLLEGWRREEMAAALSEAFTEAGGNFDKDTFLGLTESKEGQLFPDTYLLPVQADEETVVSILTKTFDERVRQGLAVEISQSGRTLIEIITMASLVEREAADEADRSVVAGILWKRLDQGWSLDVDASLQYAKGYDATEKTWWKPPTAADKTIVSPYNTYTKVGLPPAPICSPSLSSIKATLQPKASDYWFYLTDNQGVTHYAMTIEEQMANIQKYLR
ncbi:hypothetical protein A3A66_02950 [Microgenomates group bacterium RIFCSPLOWO2_01_FULL_46_13]|nr:MAG: hypothetical protein A2783_05275 [Microgenomates group bacterium RIFCSPHIGHO2_01_FULL_45_11]OGV95131.1 MAG: hypothetical protein A3A66_02950 [Microgenomates group bacterium RIFCSPLOWO2_01_FULL_46_13]